MKVTIKVRCAHQMNIVVVLRNPTDSRTTKNISKAGQVGSNIHTCRWEHHKLVIDVPANQCANRLQDDACYLDAVFARLVHPGQVGSQVHTTRCGTCAVQVGSQVHATRCGTGREAVIKSTIDVPIDWKFNGARLETYG